MESPRIPVPTRLGAPAAGSTGPEARLADLVVVVDGSGPVVDCVATALRACGVGRVIRGRYAAESLSWATPPSGRRGRRMAHDREGLAVAAVVAISRGALDPLVSAPWHRAGILHLPIEVHDAWVQVGPLVIPEVSACLGCRARTGGHVDRGAARGPDRAGYADRLGLDAGAGAEPDPGVAVLAAAVAGLTVRQALHGDHSLAGISCDIVGTRPEIVHRYWPAHPDCRCVKGTARSA